MSQQFEVPDASTKLLEIKSFCVAIKREVKMKTISINLRYDDKYIYCGHHN